MEHAEVPARAASTGFAAHRPRLARFLEAWTPLLVLQVLVATLVLYPFLSGSDYFAFLDIGSDTYVIGATHMHFARMLAREGFSGWTFGIGLGVPVAFAYNDIIGHLTQVAGAEHVLQLRIWAYVLKLLAGGGFFLLLASSMVRRKEAALLAALSYTFCGYIVTNGQWDSETNLFVFAPLVLWAIRRHLRTGDVVALPVALAAMLLSGVFFLLAGVSLAYVFLAHVALSPVPRETVRVWLRQVAPLVAIGFVLAAPYVLPLALQLLDSPRVGGGRPAGELLAGLFTVTPGSLWLAQAGGFFHKDLFGIGGNHSSYMNYLESPGFYVGMLPLVLLPQLWRGDHADRRVLVVGLVAIGLYLAFPVFRLAAFGLSAPYFRGTTLWVALAVLLMGMRALDRVLSEGVDARLLGVGAGTTLGVLALVWWLGSVSPAHAMKVAIVVGVWSALLALSASGRLAPARLPSIVLALLLVELVTMAWPSYFVLRTHAAPELNPMAGPVRALAAVRADHPPPFYRVEKTFESFSHADSLAQDYAGVRSYYYHGRGIVRFHEGMDLMHEFGIRPVNYTNWLPAPDTRFMLHSALGVRYILSKTALAWPGLEKIAEADGVLVYRNELALPLGVVHSAQVSAAGMAALAKLPLERSRWFKDVALMNAAVVDQFDPRWGSAFDLEGLVAKGEIDTVNHYANPALALQRTGLKITGFRSDRIEGTIQPDRDGILVFSIPAYRGWTLKVDGAEVPMITANFGMLAATVAAGPHRIELTYRLPGLREGLFALLLGAAVLAGVWIRSRRSRAQAIAANRSDGQSGHASPGTGERPGTQ